MFLTPNNIEELLNIIDYSHVFFIAKTIGTEILSDKDIKILENNGINIKGLPKETLLKNAFKFGVLAESLGHNNTSSLSYEDFKKYIKAGKYIPLTISENHSLEVLKHQSYKDIKGLGNKISADLRSIIIEGDQQQRAKYEKIIESTAKEVMENRETVKDMVSKLGHKTQDWQRDLGRISDYIMNNSYQEGKAAAIEEKNEGDSLVFKSVFPGACKHCIRLYLTEGIGSKPIIFKLSQLRANGTNIGRKVAEWKATLGSLHVWCRCEIHEFPKGYIWSEEKKIFELPENFVRQVQRKSKVKVTIGEKEFLV